MVIGLPELELCKVLGVSLAVFLDGTDVTRDCIYADPDAGAVVSIRRNSDGELHRIMGRASRYTRTGEVTVVFSREGKPIASLP